MKILPKTVIRYALLVGLGLLPLIILPFTEQFVVQSKMLLMFAVAAIVVAGYILRSIRMQFLSVTISPLAIPLLTFGGAVLISSFVSSNYPVEDLLGNGGLYLAGIVIALLGGGMITNEKISQHIVTVLLGSSSLVTIASALQLASFGPSRLLNTVLPLELPHTLVFNIAGSSLIALELGVIALVGLTTALLTKQVKMGALHIFLGVLTAVGIALHGWAILPGQDSAPNFLPWTASYSIAIDTLKTPRSALIGFGPAGYADAFNAFKPSWMNTTDNWNIQYIQGSNIFFTLITTTGLLGLASFLFIVYALLKQHRQIEAATKPVHFMILAILVILTVLPPNFFLISLLVLLITFWIANEADRFGEMEVHGLTLRIVKRRTNAQSVSNNGKVIVYSVSLLLTLVLVGLIYGYGRAYAADTLLLQASRKASQNDAVAVYDLQRQAVRLNPYSDVLRRRYSNTNLAIAAALSQKADRTESETQQLSQLIQQAISEGRAAAALDENDANNWANLAQIYNSLIGVAEGADQWAVTSYVNAIQTAPTNPNLRLQLGGLLFAQEQYQEALQFFQQAINLKPDLANAYYNLANTHVKLGQYQQAKTAYQQTLLLVEPDSEDYIVASNELAEIEEILEAGISENEGTPQVDETETAPSITTQNAVQTPNDTINTPSGSALPPEVNNTPPAEPTPAGEPAADATQDSPPAETNDSPESAGLEDSDL